MPSSERDTYPAPTARLGALLLGGGALGLIATCVAYVLAGPQTALPGGATNAAMAMAATPLATTWMRMAGLLGMPSDVLLAVGALLLATYEFQRRASLAMAGWLTLAIASALFIVVDAMVAMVLPVAAAQAGGEAAYAGLRALFDGLFAIGAWTAGAGALAVAWRTDGTVFRWLAVAWGLRVAGLVAVLASAAHLLGWPGVSLIGPGVALLALATLGTAWTYATHAGGQATLAVH